MSRVKEHLTILSVLWIIWVWEPLVRGVGGFFHSWAVHFGLRPCCDSPKLRVTGDPRYTVVQECLSCGRSRAFSASCHFFP
jgi:hypothetical protein